MLSAHGKKKKDFDCEVHRAQRHSVERTSWVRSATAQSLARLQLLGTGNGALSLNTSMFRAMTWNDAFSCQTVAWCLAFPHKNRFYFGSLVSGSIFR